MKILLMTDIEGITNVDSYDSLQDKSGIEYKIACENLMLDTNAAIDGYYAAGVEKVYVYDGHGSGKGRNTAKSLPVDEARRLISEGAKESVKLIGKIKPYSVSLPAEILVTFQRTDYCDEVADRYERVDSRTVKKVVTEIKDYSSLIL